MAILVVAEEVLCIMHPAEEAMAVAAENFKCEEQYAGCRIKDILFAIFGGNL